MDSVALTNESDSSESTPIVIHSPMTFQPGTEIHVICDSTINVELPDALQIYLDPGHPVKFSAAVRTTLVPVRALGDVFVRRWRQVPEELKLQVMENCVPVGRKISAIGIGETPPSPRDFGHSTELYKLLSMRPEIAQLAHEAFYKTNVIVIKSTYRLTPFTVDLPPLAARTFIRRIYLEIVFTRYHFGVIRAVSQGEYGLKHVMNASVVFRWKFQYYRDNNWHDWVTDVVNHRLPNIHFNCSGDVSVKDMPLRWGADGFRRLNCKNKQQWLEYLNKRIIIQN
jgi:hypothetical protein